MNVRITLGETSLKAMIYPSETGRALMEVLPLETNFSVSSNGFHFSTPMHPPEPAESGPPSPRKGDIAYLHAQESLLICLQTGKAGSDKSSSIQGPISPIGRILGDADPLSSAVSEGTIRIEPDDAT